MSKYATVSPTETAGGRTSAFKKRLVIVGASGMVGGCALRYALQNPRLAAAPFVAGEQFSAADITALVTIDFAAKALGVSTPKEHEALTRWYKGVSARPSATA